MSESAERLLRLRDEASLLVESGDYDTALAKIDAARVLYDMMPNQEREGMSMEYRALDSLTALIEKRRLEQRSSSQGVRRWRNEYVKASC